MLNLIVNLFNSSPTCVVKMHPIGGTDLSVQKSKEDDFLSGLNFHEPYVMHVEMDPGDSSIC